MKEAMIGHGEGWGTTPPTEEQPPARCVVQVWLEGDKARNGDTPPFRIIETEFPDFATFLEFVEDDRLISGDWLHTRWSKDELNVRVIRDRNPIAFRGAEVRKAQLPGFRIVEGAGA